MKRFLCFFCSVVICLMMTAAVAESIQPLYIEAQCTSVSLTIDSNGKATCSGLVSAKTNSTTTNVTLTLKKSSNGKTWSQVKSWSASGTGLLGAAVEETYIVSKGYQYKVTVSGKMYDASGNLLESVTQTSSIKSY